jgi:ABC-type sugar transport system substrate-binding protein
MLAKIKFIIAGAAGIALALFAAFRSGGKSKVNKIKAEAEETAREYENAGSEAMIGGLEKEAQVKNEKVIDIVKRDHFS